MLSDEYYKLQVKLQHLIVVLNANGRHDKSDAIYTILHELGMEFENTPVLIIYIQQSDPSYLWLLVWA